MNIRTSLEKEHSSAMTKAIIAWVCDDRARFRELMDIFLGGPYRITQRAAWPLSYAAVSHPTLVRPYIPRLLQLLAEKGHHPAIHRNILRIFQETGVPEVHAARLFDLCSRFIPSASEPVAVRAFAITTAAGIAEKYPGLRRELRLLLDGLQQHPQPPAIRVRVKRALKQI
jgi:hypothetical protein